MADTSTKMRIMRQARGIIRGEKVTDFINDPRQFIRRVRMGYYSDRLVYVNRWLINDEQQQINAYYGKKPAKSASRKQKK